MHLTHKCSRRFPPSLPWAPLPPPPSPASSHGCDVDTTTSWLRHYVERYPQSHDAQRTVHTFTSVRSEDRRLAGISCLFRFTFFMLAYHLLLLVDFDVDD